MKFEQETDVTGECLKQLPVLCCMHEWDVTPWQLWAIDDHQRLEGTYDPFL